MKILIASFLSFVTITFLTFSCKKIPTASSETALEGSWEFVGYKALGLETPCNTENPKVTLEITKTENERKVSGRSFVNRYFSKIESTSNTALGKGEIKFLVIGSTKMAGSPEMMKCEQTYFKTLQNVSEFTINGQELYLLNNQNPEPLTMVFKKK